MTLLIAGYWPTTYWPSAYWQQDYWSEYGTGGYSYSVTIELFTMFDYPRTVTLVDVTEGYTDTDGSWVPESTVETDIEVHISDLSWKERQFLDDEIIEHGARKLASDSSNGIVVGDRIKIIEEDSSETTWFVHSRMYESNLMKKYLDVSRETFLIARK